MARYVRNRRPRALAVWALGSRIRLGGRGSSDDTVAVADAALADPDLLGYIDLGLVEEVDQLEYLARRRGAGRNGGRRTPGESWNSG